MDPLGNFHGMLIEEYRAKFGKHGEVISKIDCQLCGSEVVHRNSAIKGNTSIDIKVDW